MKRSGIRKNRFILVISIITALFSLFVLMYVILFNTRIFTGKNGRIINNFDNSSETNETDDRISAVTEFDSVQAKDETFLLCGLDESELMTDIIMYVSVDFEKKQINILQIPRDTFVINGVSNTGKINSAYNYGDKKTTPINRLVSVINDQYKLRVDHYATITVDSFRKAVDAIGGIPVNMPYQVGNEQLGIIPKGYQILDGEKAEWLVRHRHSYYDQDIGRIKMQRLFMASAVKKAKSLGLHEISRLIPVLYGEVTTDLTINELLDLVSSVFQIPMENIEIFVIPGEGVNKNGQAVWSMHKKETAELLNEHFRPYSDKVESDFLPITELLNTGEYYENTEDDFESLIDGKIPGKKN